jgi:hypothetical protein
VAGTVRIAIDAKVRAQRERKAAFCELVEPESETRRVSHWTRPPWRASTERASISRIRLSNLTIPAGRGQPSFSGIEKETGQMTVERGKRGAQLEWLT